MLDVTGFKTSLNEIKWLKKQLKYVELSRHEMTKQLTGKYVVSYGRSGLYDLYNSKDELICDGVNYKDLNNILGK